MRHMIKTVCCLMLMAAVQGTALADPMKIPAPPPPATSGDSCSLLTECQESLKSCQQDVDMLLPALAKCEGTDVDTIRKKYDIVSGDTTVKVVKRDPPKRPRKPKTPPKAIEGKPGPQGPAGPEGPQGPQGPKGDDGTDGQNGQASRIKVATEAPGKNCPAGGTHMMIGIDADGQNGLSDGEVETDVYVCNGKAGTDGERGRDGYSRIQIEVGTRFASIFSAGRPTGWSVAPELGMKYWLSPTVELDLGAAWAPGRDRNMVITGQVCRRGINSRIGFCLGGQYLGWNLEGGLALWHSALATAAVKFVPIETRHVDISFEAGGGVGFDGYDEAMQFAYGFTGRGALTVKF